MREDDEEERVNYEFIRLFCLESRRRRRRRREILSNRIRSSRRKRRRRTQNDLSRYEPHDAMLNKKRIEGRF